MGKNGGDGNGGKDAPKQSKEVEKQQAKDHYDKLAREVQQQEEE